MNAVVLCVGRLKEPWQRAGVEEYLKRLSRYGKYSVEQVDDAPDSLGERALQKEGEALLKRIRPGDHVVALCVEAEAPDSPGLAKCLRRWAALGSRTVLVIGGGPIGMIMLQLAKQAGASKVILSEPVEEKRAQALRLGATKTIDPIHEDVAAVLSDYCENVNVVIECVGNVHTQEDAVHFAGKCATVMFFGLASPEDSFPLKPDEVFKKELHLTSSFINPYTFERAIAVLESGTIELGELITNEVPLDDIVDVFTKPEYRRTGKVMIRIS